jgi:MFS transporter, DHA1 family, inner membrane transport protein
MSQAATTPRTTGTYQPRREVSVNYSRLAVNRVPIERGAADAAAGVGKLQVLLMGSGIVAAAQIGKGVISVPMIRSDLALGLDFAGLIVATFATIGAMMGIGAGLVVSRLGAGRSLIGGMGIVTLGNLVGATAPDQCVLLIARLIEGIGFLAVVLAIPSMLAQRVARERRDFVMAVWSAYMPIGIMLMLLVAPLLPAIGWRNFWLANALATGSCAILLAIHAPATPTAARVGADRFFADALTIVRRPSCLILAFAFFAYSCQIFSLTFALPLLLTSAYGVSLGAAGLLGAMVLAVSAIGHLSSGLLLRAGVPIWANVATAFGFFAVSGFAVYGHLLPPQGIALVAALALGVGGLAPGAIYAAAPHAAPAPSVVPPTIGLVQQASSLGQFAGPASLGLWVEHFGWQAVPAILVPAALLGLASALALRRILATAEQRGRNERQGLAREWRSR